MRECAIADADRPLAEDEAAQVASAVEKRRREFTAGRACAHAALRALGSPARSLLISRDRAPLWPPSIVGSITHSDRYCGAAVAHRARVCGLGVDIEETSRFGAELLDLVCTPFERRTCHEWAGDKPTAGAVLFSAKEAFFKCQFPLTAAWLGFHDVEIRRVPDTDRFRVTLLKPGIVPRDGPRIRGRYRIVGGVVATAVVLGDANERDE